MLCLREKDTSEACRDFMWTQVQSHVGRQAEGVTLQTNLAVFHGYGPESSSSNQGRGHSPECDAREARCQAAGLAVALGAPAALPARAPPLVATRHHHRHPEHRRLLGLLRDLRCLLRFLVRLVLDMGLGLRFLLGGERRVRRLRRHG